MEHKYYTGEQILEAFSEVGVGAGDASEVLSYLGGLPSAKPKIIRCRDCKYWNEYEHINGKPELFPFCGLHMTFFREDDFCSHAERRTDG